MKKHFVFLLALTACQYETPIGTSGDAATDTPGDLASDTPADVPVDVPVDVPADRPADVPTDGDVCASARATFDCGTEQIATSICATVRASGGGCTVCTQSVDESNRAVVWMALEASGCACPRPRLRCGMTDCGGTGAACVYPPGPGICPSPDAGICPPGCPGCPPLTLTPTCQRSSTCAADDCNCLSRALCTTGTGVCTMSMAGVPLVRCLGA